MNNKKYKINSVDIVLSIVSICFVLVLAISTFSNKAQIDISKNEKILITVSIPAVNDKHASLIKSKDNVYLTEDESVGGTVVSAIAASSKREVTYENKTRILQLSNKVDTTVVIECDGVKKGKKYHISGSYFSVGDTITLSSPKYSGVGVITDITIGEN